MFFQGIKFDTATKKIMAPKITSKDSEKKLNY